MTMTIHANCTIAINDRTVGRIKGLTSGGHEQNVSNHQRVRVYTACEDTRTFDVPHDFDLPAYVDGKVNPDLEAAIRGALNA